MAAAGYPAAPRKGDVITGLPANPAGTDDAMVFHAGTAWQGGELNVTGGRVLCVTALGDSVKAAQQHAYAALAPIQFNGAQWRTDIGHRAIVKR
jgi:phosphoribosylamine--glycine ligase